MPLPKQTINPAAYNADYASDMHFIDKKTGFMLLYPSLYYFSNIVQTKDGGLTWTELTSPFDQAYLKHILYQ